MRYLGHFFFVRKRVVRPFSSLTNEPILTNSVMSIIPLEAALTSSFLIPAVSNSDRGMCGPLLENRIILLFVVSNLFQFLFFQPEYFLNSVTC